MLERSLPLKIKKWPNLQRAITNEVFFRIYSTVTQVIISSLPIYSSSYEALDILLTREKSPDSTKGHNSRNIFQNLYKS